MTTLKNASGTKAVHIRNNPLYNSYECFYVQIYKGEEQVLDSNNYVRISAAKKWAANKLK